MIFGTIEAFVLACVIGAAHALASGMVFPG
jgi:hypothetical protein